MMRLFLASMFAALPLLALGPPAALAQPVSKSACEADGGTFTNDQGTKTCVTSDPVGNAQSPHAQAVDSSTAGFGSGKDTPSTNQNVNQSQCTGPGNGNSTAQCP
jgi:hypothetical protein